MKVRRAVVLVALVLLPAAPGGADPLPGGTFDAFVAFTPGPSYEAVTAAHLDGDDTVDVAATVPGALHVFPGDGTGKANTVFAQTLTAPATCG